MGKGKRTDQRGRSKGELKHVRHYDYELASPAYRALPCTARALYTEIKRFHNGSNNGELFMSVRIAAELLGVAPNTAGKALKKLQAHGFIMPHVKGAFTRKVRHATTWVLTEYSLNRSPPTRDYQRWHMNSKKQNTVSYIELTVPKSDTANADNSPPFVS